MWIFKVTTCCTYHIGLLRVGSNWFYLVYAHYLKLLSRVLRVMVYSWTFCFSLSACYSMNSFFLILLLNAVLES